MDPVMEVRLRQLRWAQLLANVPSLVGVVHCHVAWDGSTWREPTAALSSALQSVGWHLRRNPTCGRAPSWPFLLPEPTYFGNVVLQPIDSFPLFNAAFTDA